jgi:eukaryotic-like serine/threonine-protein kinase
VIGQVVGKYRLAEKIGEGGMGVVYRAEHLVLGSPAAIKILLPKWTKNRQVVDRFFTEARAASAISHVGIVQVFDSGRLASGQAFIAMELLTGIGLGDLIQRERVLSPAVAVSLAAQILGALGAAHGAGVIHRDLKPDNIQLTHDPSAVASLRVKLLDFGIAKLLLGDQGRRVLTRSGVLLGTPTYMSPEQCSGGGVDARADLYAVGCILFEMLTGRPPFESDDRNEIVAMQLRSAPPRLRSLAPSLPPELEQLVDQLLAKDPEQRTPSAEHAHAELQRLELPALGATPALLPPPPATPNTALAVLPLAERSTGRAPATTFHVRGDRRPEPEPTAASMMWTQEETPRLRFWRRWAPLIVLGVALLIAAVAILLIGASGELLPEPELSPPLRR